MTTKEGRAHVLDKIRGCVSDIIRSDEYNDMKSKGLISSVDELLALLNQAKSYLSHNCTERCQVLRTTKDGEQFFVCKVQDNFLRGLTPFQHTIQPVMVHHTPEAKAIYQRLGMMDGDTVLENCLKAERHIPVCSSSDPKFSPTNGWLFACFPSSQNIQYPTGYYVSAYLTKYIASIDEVAIVVFRPREGYAKATIESMHNTKISSNKHRLEARKRQVTNSGRYLTQMEALTVIIGAPLVMSTVQFIHIPTSPREYRAAFKKDFHPNGARIPSQGGVTTRVVIGQEVRESLGFLPCRCFSSRQIEVIEDELQSTLTTCKITQFSVRPPELRFVNKVSLYFRWFDRENIIDQSQTLEEIKTELDYRLDYDMLQCEWIDGFNTKIIVRRAAISEILQYITRECKGIELFGTRFNKSKTVVLFSQIKKLLAQFESAPRANTRTSLRHTTRQTSHRQYEEICELFLSSDKSWKLPVVWTTPVFPRNKNRFLIYFLLRFGRFETEYELMKQGDLRSAYIHAGLFNAETPQTQRSTFDNLMTVYVRQCLHLQTGSRLQRDRNLVLAQSALGELLMGQTSFDGNTNLGHNQPAVCPIVGTPCVLQAHMREETTEKIAKFGKTLTESFLCSLVNDLVGAGFDAASLPSKAHIMKLCYPETNTTPSATTTQYTFPPPYNPNSRQSLESYNEQKEVLLKAKSSIDCFKNGYSHSNLVICGGPGNGKTTTSNEICLYAFSCGLKGIATSIVADRSKVLGGIHIHLFCGLHGKITSPGRTAEAAIRVLYRKPELFEFWKRLQFLYIDEFGVVNAETLAVIDIIARKVKNSHRFMGGMLVIGTMDIYQLQPVEGHPVMLSMNMTSEFVFAELQESVRAANDENLRRICKLCRTLHWTTEKENEFKRLIKENCRFVPSLDDPSIPEEAVFVFGRKRPCQMAEALLIKRIKRTYGNGHVVVSKSNDEESTRAGNWKEASVPVSRDLSQKIKEKRELHLYEKGRYEFTYNLQDTFQQGQLGILLSFNKHDVSQQRALQLFKGPPGCKEFPPPEDFIEPRLLALGWTPVMVPFDYSRSTQIWGSLYARRQQYGIRPRVASTIHASMGSTYSAVVTAVSNNPLYSGVDFTLWEAAQVVVLISRTGMCRDLYFVGEPDEVADQLLIALRNTSRYLSHIRSVLNKLCGHSNNTVPVLPCSPIFQPRDIILESVPSVYLLVSTKEYKYMYIGETSDIRKRLNDHNSGQGSRFTNNPRLRPWALYGYVYMFDTKAQRRRFEGWWQRTAQNQVRLDGSGTPAAVLAIATRLAAVANRHRRPEKYLRIQQCGDMMIAND